MAMFSQSKPVFEFMKDDTLLRKQYYKEAADQQDKLIASVDKKYKDDYKLLYEERFKTVKDLFKSNRAVTEVEAYNYLQSILKKITEGNPELRALKIRLVFTRDGWPNAYSIGDGTIAVNMGLMVFLSNEAELAFVLCHELAHYYLDHSGKRIKKFVETANSDEYKEEFKRISKSEFKIREQLEKLMKKFVYGASRHSRENETEADLQGFLFLKKSGFDCRGMLTGLALLDKIDDSTIYHPLDLIKVFDFSEFPFRKRWVEKESVIFGAMTKDDSPLTRAEKDSMKTHPDCQKRIINLRDSAMCAGKEFQVNEELFNRLKRSFFVEMTEELFRQNNITGNLYYCLQMLQDKDNEAYAIYSIARDLNLLYEYQRDHKLGLFTDKESRYFPQDLNLLLRMIDRLRLDELADLNYYFCRQHIGEMAEYGEFNEEFKKAEQLKNKQ
jgi:hypothetical protein